MFVIGTAHVSAESADQVRSLVSLVKPDLTLVELCGARHLMISAEAMKASDPQMSTRQLIEQIQRVPHSERPIYSDWCAWCRAMHYRLAYPFSTRLWRVNSR